MIVAERKPFDEIKAMLAGYGKVFILGCDTCVSVCMAGGRKEVGLLASQLRMSFKKDGSDVVIDEDTVERQCNKEYMELVLNKLKDYQVRSVTEGKDSLGEVRVVVEVNGKAYAGTALSIDVVEASAKAYVRALNNAYRAGAVT